MNLAVASSLNPSILSNISAATVTCFMLSISSLSIIDFSPKSLNELPLSKLTFSCILPPINDSSSTKGTPTVTCVDKLFQYLGTSFWDNATLRTRINPTRYLISTLLAVALRLHADLYLLAYKFLKLVCLIMNLVKILLYSFYYSYT